MIKKFKIFEAHLIGRQGEEREFKISASQASSNKLMALTAWQEGNQISFLDLTKNDIHLERSADQLEGTDIVILVRPTTFELKKVNTIRLNEYRLFRIIGIPENFPSKYAIIKEADFESNKSYSTLNLNKMLRGSNTREIIFLKLLGKETDSPIDTGILEQEYEENLYEWDEEIEAYFGRYNYRGKMTNQVNTITDDISDDYDLILKDYNKLFINEKARELFNSNPEYSERNYNFYTDKWNPADIWLVKGDIKELKRTVNSFTTLVELNQWLAQCIENSIGIIGISLKLRSEDATYLDKVNTSDSLSYTYEYNGYDLTTDSMSVIINYNWIDAQRRHGLGKIEIRNFSGGRRMNVALEIKSTGHTSGKLTGSLRSVFYNTNFFNLQNILINPEQTKETLLANIDQFELEDHVKEDFEEILNNGKEFDYKERSKLQGLLIVSKVMTHTNGSNWAINQMVNYGRSQTDISAPHYVLK